MNILITGGAGYIGSHVTKQLLEIATYNIIILDNLSTGSTKTLDTLKIIIDFKFIELDLKEVSKTNFKVETSSRRVGNSSVLVSDNSKIKSKMNWVFKYENFSLISQRAYEWENKLGDKVK